MKSNQEFRTAAKQQLGKGIFSENWLLAVLVILIFSAVIGASGIVAVGPLLLTGPMSAGVLAVFLKLKRTGQRINISDMFNEAFSGHFLQYFLVGLLTGIFTFLWGLLFVIPGIVKSYAYAMAPYLAIHDPEMKAMDCIDNSKAIMKGHKGQLFLLDLSFIGWYILGSLCCGIGTLWVEAYRNTARANFFDDLYSDFMQVKSV